MENNPDASIFSRIVNRVESSHFVQTVGVIPLVVILVVLFGYVSVHNFRILSYLESSDAVAAVSTTNLVGRWALNEGVGSTTIDSSGLKNTGTLVGPLWTAGAQGNGLSFDGIDDRVEIKNATSLNATKNLTVSVWVKFAAVEDSPATSKNARFLQKGTSKGTTSYALVYKNYSTGDFPEFRVRIGGTLYAVTGKHSFTPAQWYHVVGVRNAGNMMLYVNGTLESSRVVSKSAISTTTSRLYLGESVLDQDGAFQGVLDNVSIYTRALTSSEVAQLYQDEKPVILSFGEAPYPKSSVITGITFAPTSTITRAADGSDNWPLTWGDDDSLYGAYGDGNGFEPFISTKVGLGFAKISGDASTFLGTNIRSPTGEQIGNGQLSKKASSLLMVDGTLYLLARNVFSGGTGCQLATSPDHGVTWTWTNLTFKEFGYCVFLNFGKNYAGARDGYVYIYSNNGPSAYLPADNFILMRVPLTNLTDRLSYEFYKGLDASSSPMWTYDITLRAPVFTHTGHAQRSSISYDSGIGRYIWWQMYPDPVEDERFQGGFGVYDAPEPWGPWTTVYFTKSWDVGPGETGSFPTKWMSPDGKTLYLVSSSNDAFSVRQATLTVMGSTSTNPY